MAIMLNHTIVPARDKAAAAKFFADIFGLKRGRSGYFVPVKVNKSLTLLFDDEDKFESHHLAFHVNNREFDAIFRRIKAAKIVFGSAPLEPR
jgi:catechol 2,3-dioxygenase-like lactoylglutathione lyase family enzyme